MIFSVRSCLRSYSFYGTNKKTVVEKKSQAPSVNISSHIFDVVVDDSFDCRGAIAKYGSKDSSIAVDVRC